MKQIDSKEREQEILELLVRSYIEESKPISSQYLQKKYSLPYSPATIRNIMVDLEKKGYIAHVHTSSGRIPTLEGFKYYVHHLKRDEIVRDCGMGLEISEGGSLDDIDILCEHTMDILSRISGYTSIMARGDSDHHHEKIVCRGTRYFLEQPEFADYGRLKSLLFALEEKIRGLQTVMLSNLDEGIKIMVGDEMGLDEVAGCSLVVSGSREPRLPFVMALLGPVRMDYIKAATSLYSLKQRLTEIVKRLP